MRHRSAAALTRPHHPHVSATSAEPPTITAMKPLLKLPALSALSTVIVIGLSSCGIAADHVAKQAARELATDVRELVLASSTAHLPPSSFGLLGDALNEVVDAEQDSVHADGSFVVRYTGLTDSDDDGFDDDGRVEIIVRRSSACLVARGDTVDVTDGPC